MNVQVGKTKCSINKKEKRKDKEGNIIRNCFYWLQSGKAWRG